MKINTAFGTKTIVRRVGAQGEYHLDISGGWWLLNPQHGWVPVASNGRALLAALETARAS